MHHRALCTSTQRGGRELRRRASAAGRRRLGSTRQRHARAGGGSGRTTRELGREEPHPTRAKVHAHSAGGKRVARCQVHHAQAPRAEHSHHALHERHAAPGSRRHGAQALHLQEATHEAHCGHVARSIEDQQLARGRVHTDVARHRPAQDGPRGSERKGGVQNNIFEAPRGGGCRGRGWEKKLVVEEV